MDASVELALNEIRTQIHDQLRKTKAFTGNVSLTIHYHESVVQRYGVDISYTKKAPKLPDQNLTSGKTP